MFCLLRRSPKVLSASLSRALPEVPRLKGLLDFEGKLPAQMAVPEFEEVVAEKIGVQLTEQELITVLRNCGDAGTADVRFDKLCESARLGAWEPPRERGQNRGPPKIEWSLCSVKKCLIDII